MREERRGEERRGEERRGEEVKQLKARLAAEAPVRPETLFPPKTDTDNISYVGQTLHSFKCTQNTPGRLREHMHAIEHLEYMHLNMTRVQTY